MARTRSDVDKPKKARTRAPRQVRSKRPRSTAAAPPLPLTVHIDTFGNEPYEALRPLEVLIRPENGHFLASFFPANVHTAGETDQEAFDNLRTLILDTMDMFADVPDASLSQELRRQRNTLFDYVKRLPA